MCVRVKRETKSRKVFRGWGREAELGDSQYLIPVVTAEIIS